ncbi:MAG TPA: hypothetical protein VK805_19515 [Candidatus Baltobacteraceae bacterium]|jgi:hypothetical protein|nr:hypothetical protein [Candidatus Baltobacteraceae bacterium]
MASDQLVGIGGWLALLICKLCVGTVVRSAGIANPNRFVAVISGLTAVLAGVAAYLLLTKNRKGVTVAKVYLAIDAVLYLLIVAGSAVDARPDYKAAGFCLASILYFLYLMRSKRVKNTYFASHVAQ